MTEDQKKLYRVCHVEADHNREADHQKLVPKYQRNTSGACAAGFRCLKDLRNPVPGSIISPETLSTRSSIAVVEVQVGMVE